MVSDPEKSTNGISCATQTENENVPFTESSNAKCPYDGLCEDLNKLYLDQACLDTSLKSGDKTFEAHRSVLAARSPVFAAMFRHDTTENRTGVVNIPDVEATTLQDMLDYAYKGKVEDMTLDKAKCLYVAADKYAMEKLKAVCREFLLSSLSLDTLYDIAVLSDDHEDSKMKESISMFIAENMSAVHQCDQWSRLTKERPVLVNKFYFAYVSMNARKNETEELATK